jgi:hypothetical protein
MFGRLQWPLLSLTFLAAGCVSNRMTTREVYGEILWVGVSFRCHPIATARHEMAEDRHVGQRLAALHPWLESELGPGVMAAMVADFDTQIEGVYFTGCPSDEEHSHGRTRYRMLVNELENRAHNDVRHRAAEPHEGEE